MALILLLLWTARPLSPWIFGAEYRDAGASCSDVWAGDLDIIVSGDTVNTGAAGTYNINYDCLDNDGNEANQISRTVIVNPQPAPVQTGGGGVLIPHIAPRWLTALGRLRQRHTNPHYLQPDQ